MELHDFWIDLEPVFTGKAEDIREIDLTNLNTSSMAQCILYLLTHAKEFSSKFVIKGTDTQILLSSPHEVVNTVLQDQVSVAMWVTLPSIPVLSVYIDFVHEINFGYVKGAWNAMAVLAFFDLIYELKRISPDAQMRPSAYTHSSAERDLIMTFWQDYQHATT